MRPAAGAGASAGAGCPAAAAFTGIAQRGVMASGCSSGAGSAQPTVTPTQQAKADTTSGMHIFWGSGSPPAWRVLLAAAEKGLKYTDHLLSFERGDTKAPWFLKLNPRGLVPLLVDDGVVVAESLAILEYLDRFYPDKPLTPKDKVQCARALRLAHESNQLASISGEIVFYVRRTPPHALNVEYLTAKRAQMHKELALWESFLHGRDYLVGSAISVADVAFFPQLAYNTRIGLQITRYPNLHAYYNRMCARPSVQRHWPPHWAGTTGLPILSDRLPTVKTQVPSAVSPPPSGGDSDDEDAAMS